MIDKRLQSLGIIPNFLHPAAIFSGYDGKRKENLYFVNLLSMRDHASVV